MSSSIASDVPSITCSRSWASSRRSGVQFISLDDGIDTNTPSGRLFMQIRGAFAEYERALILERTKAGVETARRKGKRFGRPPVTDRRQRERIVRLRKAGRSLREIVELTGVSKTTALRVLEVASAG